MIREYGRQSGEVEFFCSRSASTTVVQPLSKHLSTIGVYFQICQPDNQFPKGDHPTAEFAGSSHCFHVVSSLMIRVLFSAPLETPIIFNGER